MIYRFPLTVVLVLICLFAACIKNEDSDDLRDELSDAAERGNLDDLERIVSSSAFDESSDAAQAALHISVGLGKNEFALRLMQIGVDPSTIYFETQETALHVATAAKNMEMINAIVEAGVTPCILDGLGMTPLHWAARNNDVEALLVLLEGNGKDCLNQQAAEVEGRTALHLGVGMGNYDAAKMLIEYGADAYMMDDNGIDAIDLAEQKGFGEIVELLRNSQ